MALTLDATPAGAASNSYAGADAAARYFAARRNAEAWTGAAADVQAQALAAATQRLEQEQYVGRRATPAQALKWPRACACDEDGVPYPVALVPGPVVAACCELALWLLNSGDTDPLAPTGLEQFAALGVGALDLTPNAAAPAAGALPPQVLRLLRGLLTTSTGAVRLVRG